MYSGGGAAKVRAMNPAPSKITVDPAARTVTVTAGATWGELDAATQRHGLAVTGARVSSAPVGLAGDGWLVRSMGLISDNLVAARLPGGAAAGEEALRSLRGSAGEFAELTLRLRPLGPEIRGGVRAYPAERAAEVLAAYREALDGAPPEVGGGVVLTNRGVEVVVVGEEPALEVPATIDTVGSTTYERMQRLLDPVAAAGDRWSVQSGLMTTLTDGAIDVLAMLAGELATPAGHVLVQPLGGAYAAPEVDTPVGHRDAGWAYRVAAGWTDPRHDNAERAWSLAAAAELEPYDRGVAFPGLDGGRARPSLAAAV